MVRDLDMTVIRYLSLLKWYLILLLVWVLEYPDRSSLVFWTGCAVVVLLGIRVASDEHRFQSGSVLVREAVGTARLIAPDNGTTRKLRSEYEGDYVDWVYARCDPTATAAEIMAYAHAWHSEWAKVDGSQLRSQESMARHEAAHAVVAHVLGCTVIEVSIVPEAADDTFGRTTIHMPVPRVDYATEGLVAMSVLLAGRDADTAVAIHDLAAGSDMARLVQTAAGVISTGRRPAGYDGPLTIDGLVSAAAARTRAILTDHAGAVEAIKDGLLADALLTGSQLRALLGVR